MKKFTHYLLLAMMATCLFASCTTRDDEEMGFDISGMVGKTWSVDLGEYDAWGWKYYSYFTFSSRGSTTTMQGTGLEERVDQYDRTEGMYDFDWYLDNHDLHLRYADGLRIDFYDIVTYRDRFTATVFNSYSQSRMRLTFYYEGGHAKAEVELPE